MVFLDLAFFPIKLLRRQDVLAMALWPHRTEDPSTATVRVGHHRDGLAALEQQHVRVWGMQSRLFVKGY